MRGLDQVQLELWATARDPLSLAKVHLANNNILPETVV
jgi:hypothetical protein